MDILLVWYKFWSVPILYEMFKFNLPITLHVLFGVGGLFLALDILMRPMLSCNWKNIPDLFKIIPFLSEIGWREASQKSCWWETFVQIINFLGPTWALFLKSRYEALDSKWTLILTGDTPVDMSTVKCLTWLIIMHQTLHLRLHFQKGSNFWGGHIPPDTLLLCANTTAN